MRHLGLCLCLLVGLWGCGEEAEPGAGGEGADMGVEGDLSQEGDLVREEEGEGPALPSCGIEAPAGLEVVGGGLGRLEAVAVGGVGAVEARAPEGWGAWSEGGSGVLLRAPYVGGEGSLAWSLDCGDGTGAVAETALTVRAVSWSRRWSLSGGDGPAEREHPTVWIHPEDPDGLYLFGGYLYRPRQFTPADDLWRFDLASGRWEAVAQEGERPPYVGGRAAARADQVGVVYYGGDQDQAGNPWAWGLALSSRPAVWSRLGEEGARGPSLTGFVRDAGRFVGFGGYDYARGVSGRVEVFDLEAGRWASVRPTSAQGAGPSPRYGFLYGYDEATRRLIVFSGGGSALPADPVNAHEDAWALELGQEPPRWTLLEGGATAPPGRRNGCGAWDPEGQRLFVWGGDLGWTDDGAGALRAACGSGRGLVARGGAAGCARCAGVLRGGL